MSDDRFQHLCDMLDLDEFQRIAAAELLRDLEHSPAVPAAGSVDEERLIALGAIIGERLFPREEA